MQQTEPHTHDANVYAAGWQHLVGYDELCRKVNGESRVSVLELPHTCDSSLKDVSIISLKKQMCSDDCLSLKHIDG